MGTIIKFIDKALTTIEPKKVTEIKVYPIAEHKNHPLIDMKQNLLHTTLPPLTNTKPKVPKVTAIPAVPNIGEEKETMVIASNNRINTNGNRYKAIASTTES